MIIDELVTVLAYDFPASSKAALNKMAKGTENAAGQIGKMGTSMGKLGPEAEKASKVLHKIGDQLSGIAIGAASAGAGIASALVGLTLYEGKQANALKLLSDSIGINAAEISVWSAAISAAGGNADAFKNDLQKLSDAYSGFSLEDVLHDADELKRLSDEISVPHAINQGMAWGYSRDTAQFMLRGASEIQKAVEEAGRQGHGSLQKHIDQLQETHLKYRELKETITGITNRIAGGSAPSVGRALGLINNALVDNQNSITEWATSADQKFQGFLDGVQGKLGVAKDAIAEFNGMLISDNMHSPDPEVRKKNIDELGDKFTGQITGTAIDVLYCFHLAFSDIVDPIEVA